MDHIEYQKTLIDIQKNYEVYGTEKALPSYGFGLGEESGEVLGLLKRYYRGDIPEKLREKLTKELGDTLAYLLLIGHVFDIGLEEIMTKNIEKLEGRKDNGTLLGSGDDR